MVMKNTVRKRLDRRATAITSYLMAGRTATEIKERYLLDLKELEQRWVLMRILYRGLRTGEKVQIEIPLLIMGFTQEAALPFIFAAASSQYAYSTVPELVFKLCRNTAIARHELTIAAYKLIEAAEQQGISEYLQKAAECIRLHDTRLLDRSTAPSESSRWIAKTLCITAKKMKKKKNCEAVAQETLDAIRAMANNDEVWQEINSAS